MREVIAGINEALITAGLILLTLVALPLLVLLAIVLRPLLMAGAIVGLLLSLVLCCFSPSARAWLFAESGGASRAGA